MKTVRWAAGAAAVTGAVLSICFAVPAEAAVAHTSAFYTSMSSCGTAMSSQQRAGRPVSGCYEIIRPVPPGFVQRPEYYFIYYT
jgi:hypothetical protein